MQYAGPRATSPRSDDKVDVAQLHWPRVTAAQTQETLTIAKTQGW